MPGKKLDLLSIFTLCDSSTSWAASSRLAEGVGCLGTALFGGLRCCPPSPGAVIQTWDANPTSCKSTKPTTDFQSQGELGGGGGGGGI